MLLRRWAFFSRIVVNAPPGWTRKQIRNRGENAYVIERSRARKVEAAGPAVDGYEAIGTLKIGPQRAGGGFEVDLPGRPQRRIRMQNSTKDKAQGKFHEVKGKAKEKVGRATNDRNMQAEGQDEKVGGKIQKKVGDVEKVFEK